MRLLTSLHRNNSTGTGFISSFPERHSSCDFVSDSEHHESHEDVEEKDEHEKEIRKMAHKETSQLDSWRELATGALIIAASIVTFATFIALSHQQTDSFISSFANLVGAIDGAAVAQEKAMNETFSTFADIMTAHEISNSESSPWPFVTLPFFEIMAEHVRKSTNIEFFAFSPIVPAEQKEAWESYALKNRDWIVDSWQHERERQQQTVPLLTKDDISLLLASVPRHIYSLNNNHENFTVNDPSIYHNHSNNRMEMEGTVENSGMEDTTDNHNGHSTGTAVNEGTVENSGMEDTTDIQNGHSTDTMAMEGTIENSGMEGATDIYNGHSTTEYYAPMWQAYHSPPPKLINFDALSSPQLRDLYNVMKTQKDRAYSGLIDPFLFDAAEEDGGDNNKQQQLLLPQNHKHESSSSHEEEEEQRIQSVIFQPIYSEISTTERTSSGKEPVGILQIVINWEDYLSALHPKMEQAPLLYVLKNTCGEVLSFVVKSTTGAKFLGVGDLHDEFYERFGFSILLLGNATCHEETELFGGFEPTEIIKDYHDPHASHFQEDMEALLSGQCAYVLTVYPTFEFVEAHRSNTTNIFTVVIALTFFFMAFAFFIYDKYVKARNDKMIETAAKTHAIVSSLFPSIVRDRLLAHPTQEANNNNNKTRWKIRKGIIGFDNSITTAEKQLGAATSFHEDDGNPVADFFPEATLLFTDIVGFTAWSSVREPSQVFTLLETLFSSFDVIAKRRKVFKVETIGDCYFAVAGLPEPLKDHAIAMSRFARDCLLKMIQLTKSLEVTLGPDTGDLSMRFGLHSGPVTAGVLRGQRARFQLFGDTVNTAARMESTGQRGRIQVSQETADILKNAGKGHWLKPREDKVIAKGKGEMTTYWLFVSGEKGSGSSTTESSQGQNSHVPSSIRDNEGESGSKKKPVSEKTKRLIDWNASILENLLKKVVVRRRALNYQQTSEDAAKYTQFAGVIKENGKTVLDEVKDIICLPNFDSKAAKKQESHESVELDPIVIQQLRDYISELESMYNENAFHCFEHASHVTMSVMKLLSRIVAPTKNEYEEDPNLSEKRNKKKILSKMHDHTYGITSDPLTQFAMVLSALIHDVDHVGLPNATLVKENHKLASVYKNKSIAEQNSVDLAWDLLMSSKYGNLRSVIYCNEEELKRFRELVVNTVLATDICDKELKALRDARWDKAFKNACSVEEDTAITRNRKATIVIEHLIQASDVSHTMQHWHIYRKWNERFFIENYIAYKNGHAEKDPSEYWYKGEIGFFDFYIIPLAKKLKDCGVFGVSSDEYLNYATKNREEWKIRGEKVIAEMVASSEKALHEGVGGAITP